MYLDLTEEHHAFRGSLRDFIQKEILPRVDDWEERGE
ncbi:MAG: acyl-CoA dehydrogenase family protein, partial [Sphingobacterium sp.]